MPTANKDEQQKKEESSAAIDFGAGKMSFGGLFQGLGNVFDLVARLAEEGKEEGKQEREFTSPSGRVKAVYGLSVKTNIAGVPVVESFGNVKGSTRGPVVEEERQPLVDVFDEQDHLRIIAELPGVEEEHIHTTVKGDILTLSTTSGERKYYKEVVLPKDVDANTLERKYKNGVLEIRMGKK